MTSTNGIATERHRHRQPNTKNREESVMCVSGHLVIKECDTFTCSLSSTPLPLFQHFPVSPSAFHFLFFLHLCCSLKLEYNGSSICFQFGFPAFHFHHGLSRFYSPPPFFYSVYLSPNSFCLF